jgi:putative transposase
MTEHFPSPRRYAWNRRQDESRFGVLTVRRRRFSACGVQPLGPIQHVFEQFSVSGSVAPPAGERGLLELPDLNADLCQRFIAAVAHAFQDRVTILC